MTPLQFLLTFLAAAIGGAINSMAGGGTLVTFPAIVWLGVPPISANATSTVALWPGSIGSIWAYRGELADAREWLRWFTLPSLAGGGIGAVLLLYTSASLFDEIVPFLVLGATLLFLLQQRLTRRLSGAIVTEPPRSPGLPPIERISHACSRARRGGLSGRSSEWRCTAATSARESES